MYPSERQIVVMEHYFVVEGQDATFQFMNIFVTSRTMLRWTKKERKAKKPSSNVV